MPTADNNLISGKNNNDSGLKESTIIIIVIVGSLLILCCILIILLFAFFNRKLTFAKDLELARINSGSSSANVNVGGAGGTNTSFNFKLPPVPVTSLSTNTLLLGTGENSDKNDKSGEIEQIGGELGVNVDNLEMSDKNVLNMNKNDDENDEGDKVSGMVVNTGVNGKVNNVNEANYSKWTQNEVLNWIKTHLINNGIDNNTIESFLNEFKQKYITGSMLVQLKNNPKLIDSLMKQFTKENQIFGIWLVLRSMIVNLNEFKE